MSEILVAAIALAAGGAIAWCLQAARSSADIGGGLVTAVQNGEGR